MDGQVAQIAAITAFTNAALKGVNTTPFTMDNLTARNCHKIFFIDWIKSGNISTFMSTKPKYTSKPMADNYSEWVNFLKKENTKQLFLHYAPGAVSRLKDGGIPGLSSNNGLWLIEAWNGESSDYWESTWKVTHKDAPEHRIWSTAYARVSTIDLVRKETQIGLEGLQEELTDAIQECLAFSEKHHLENWKISFERALDYMRFGKGDSIPVIQEEIIPLKEYSEEARRILFTAMASWVFGDQETWKDLSLQRKEQNIFKKISENLYSLICQAIARSINGFGQ